MHKPQPQSLNQLETIGLADKRNLACTKYLLTSSTYLLWSWLYLIFILFSSCTGLRPIKQQNPLLNKHQFEIVAKKNLPTYRTINDELQSVVMPAPNNKFLWMRPALSIYNSIDSTKRKKGPKYWLKYKVGSPPVLLHSFSPENVAKVMENRLYHLGHFTSKVNYVVTKKKRTAAVAYQVFPGPYYHIDTIISPEGSSLLEQSISHTLGTSSLKKNDLYNLQAIIKERTRIDNLLKDAGFYYFDPKYLLFQADSSKGNHGVQLKLKIKPDTPEDAFRRIPLREVYVLDDVTPEDYDPDTILLRDYHYISNRHQFHPETILDQIYLKKSEVYSRTLQNRTVKHLMDLGVHQYVNINYVYEPVNHVLDAYVYMNPLKKISLSAELNAVLRTTNYVGPGMRLSLKDRNLWGGAELFTLNLEGSFETQFGIDSTNNTYQLGLNAGISFPRLLPINLKKLSEEFISHTNVRGGLTFFRRLELFTLRSFYMNYGYNWQNNKNLFHTWNVIDVSFNNIGQETTLFLDYLENNPSVRSSFEDQFIVGSSYTFTIDHLTDPTSKKKYYLQSALDLSGNLAFLIQSLVKKDKPTEANPYKILGLAYSQFARISMEFRRPLQVGKNKIATRIKLGYGVPWGNSATLPYVRQFFTGGTNSIRAFVSRTVGPGSYVLSEENQGIDQTGDINIEGNIEYRFDFTRQLKGAVFLDAGNIWLKNEDTERPGANFKFDRFWKEFAIGSGFGLRFDIDVVIFRLDLAWPLYNPALPEGERWVIKDFNFFNSRWRKDNLLWNLGIGYPF